MKTREAIPSRHQLRPTNLGQITDVNGREGLRAMFMQKMGDESAMVSLAARCERIVVPPALLGTADYRPMIRVTWGNGQTTMDADFDVTYRRAVPFATGILNVRAWICALPFPNANTPVGPGLLDGPSTRPGTPPPGVTPAQFATVTARITSFCAAGQQLDEDPTFWLTQLGTDSGQFVVGQSRPLQARFFAASFGGVPPGQAYMLFFDQATLPVPGDIPLDGTPISLNARQDLAWGSTRTFVTGCAWAISATPFQYTAVPGALALVTLNIRM